MEFLSIVGVIATVIGAFAAVLSLYVSMNKGGNSNYVFKASGAFTQNNNLININENKYDYTINNNKPTKSTSQNEIIEYIIETSIFITKLKKIALCISAFFTFLYVIFGVTGFRFFGTALIESALILNNNTWVYFYIYISLFVVLYASLMLFVGFFYSHQLRKEAFIRNFTAREKLSRLRRQLVKQLKLNTFEEFPIRALDRMIANIAIDNENLKAVSYNNRTKHTPRKDTQRPRNSITDSLYFMVICVLMILNVIYFFVNGKHDVLPVFSPEIPFTYSGKLCESRREYITETVNWDREWKAKYANIFCDFTELHTPQGFYILNSPNYSDVYEYKNHYSVTISGYVRTKNDTYFFTKSSFDSKNPKLIYIPEIGL